MKKVIICSLAMTCLLGSISAQAQPRQAPIVAVFLMESRGSPLKGDELVGLTDYMATMLGEKGNFQIIPRDEIRKRLVEARNKSYQDCVDQSCQIEIGRELAAQYTVSSTISKVGPTCLITAALFDLRKAATVKTASTKDTCDPDRLIGAVEEITRKLEAAMTGKPVEAAKPILKPDQPKPRTVVQTSGCTKDTDCRAPRICISRRCVTPGGATDPAASPHRPTGPPIPFSPPRVGPSAPGWSGLSAPSW